MADIHPGTQIYQCALAIRIVNFNSPATLPLIFRSILADRNHSYAIHFFYTIIYISFSG